MPNDLDEKSMLLGGHEARLVALEANVKGISDDVKAIRAVIERGKGSWKTLAVLGGVIATIVE